MGELSTLYPQHIHISSTSSPRWGYFHDPPHSGLERELAMVLSPIQPSSLALENVLAHLKGGRSSLRGWKACCPAHADHQPSLSIGLGEQGQVLLKCFAGCSLERIAEAVGLAITDLFPAAPSTQYGQGPTAAA